jgi:hypothetical protein
MKSFIHLVFLSATALSLVASNVSAGTQSNETLIDKISSKLPGVVITDMKLQKLSMATGYNLFPSIVNVLGAGQNKFYRVEFKAHDLPGVEFTFNCDAVWNPIDGWTVMDETQAECAVKSNSSEEKITQAQAV